MLDEVFKDAQRRMAAAVDRVARELRSLRTGRASIAILDDVQVDYYGTRTPLNQLAALSAPEPTLLVVQPYDKSAIQEMGKAIQQADLGLNPQNDGNVIRIPIPELTEERRRELTKVVGKLAEEGKTGVRQVRRDANEEIKKLEADKAISQDEEHRGYKRIQELTDEHCERIDELAERKSQEILEF